MFNIKIRIKFQTKINPNSEEWDSFKNILKDYLKGIYFHILRVGVIHITGIFSLLAIK
jgi:hypothetical protein